MKTFLFGIVLVIATITWQPANSQEPTIENHMTRLMWCFHKSQTVILPAEEANGCQRILIRLRDYFGNNFTSAMKYHSQSLGRFLSSLPLDAMTGDEIVRVLYARKISI